MDWISVKDRLPDADENGYYPRGYSQRVDFFVPSQQDVNRFQRGRLYFGEGWISALVGKYSLDEVTHWMPLPEPPKS